MKYRNYNPVTDYAEIEQWFIKNGYPCAPQSDLLPFGIIVENKGVKKAVIFLYQATDCPYGFMEWACANPENKAIESFNALNLLVERILIEAERRGIKMISGFAESPSLIRLYEKHGFAIGRVAMRESAIRIGS